MNKPKDSVYKCFTCVHGSQKQKKTLGKNYYFEHFCSLDWPDEGRSKPNYGTANGKVVPQTTCEHYEMDVKKASG